MLGAGGAVGSNYALESPIGQGSMGQVWRARGHDGSVAAVKVLRAELTADPMAVARFLQERSILTGLNDPHLVAVLDLVAEQGRLAIVMELVEGPDLRHYLTDCGGTMAAADAVELAAQIADGLVACHRNGVVHRDLKPENVLIDLMTPTTPTVKITDFGISRIAYGPSLTKMTGLIGTPEYMAPEAAEQQHATAAADIYSLGIVLYELLAGRSPFVGGLPVAVLRRHLDEVPRQPAGLNEELWALLAQMLAKRPGDRPSSAAEVAERLRALRPMLVGVAPLPPLTSTADDVGAWAHGPDWVAPIIDDRARDPLRTPSASPAHAGCGADRGAAYVAGRSAAAVDSGGRDGRGGTCRCRSGGGVLGAFTSETSRYLCIRAGRVSERSSCVAYLVIVGRG